MLTLPKLYPITDARLCPLSHAAQVTAFVEGGARFVQVREKHLGAREFYRQAEEAAGVARRTGATLIVNDRVDIALALGADGVHLGQDDLAPEAARRLLGAGPVVGFSTHSVEQAVAAARLPVSYVAIGPIFQTGTKENPDPVVGLDGLRRVRAALPTHLPLVAIGGLDRETARAALDAGADSVAVISALVAHASDASEITRRTREFLASL
jgi:thiamine-phosphate pyrophosphorylase